MKRAILLATAFVVSICLSGFPLMAQVHEGGVPGGSMGHGRTMGQQPGMNHGPQMGHSPMQGQQPQMGNHGINPRPNARMARMHMKKSPAELLAQNTRLSGRLKTMLPTGENVQQAASGFKNLGKFVAAVNISHNLDLPFNQFKSKVTSGDSLGKAIHKMDSTLTHKEIKSQVKKAKRQARKQIHASRS